MDLGRSMDDPMAVSKMIREMSEYETYAESWIGLDVCAASVGEDVSRKILGVVNCVGIVVAF